MGVATIITATRGMRASPDCMAVKPSSSCMKSGSRNMLASRMANMAAPMREPEVKRASLNSRRSTAGTLASSSRQTKRKSETAATAAQPTMSPDENQSFR